MAELNFDSTNIEPLAPMTPLPKGRYLAAITASEMKQTKAGDGEYLQLEFSVLEGQYTGRKVWSRLNLSNPNPKAEDMARRELAAICHAVTLVRIGDSAELHDRPVTIEVAIEAGKDGAENNRITAYIQTGQAAPTLAPAAAAAATGKKAAPPWASGKAKVPA